MRSSGGKKEESVENVPSADVDLQNHSPRNCMTQNSMPYGGRSENASTHSCAHYSKFGLMGYQFPVTLYSGWTSMGTEQKPLASCTYIWNSKCWEQEPWMRHQAWALMCCEVTPAQAALSPLRAHHHRGGWEKSRWVWEGKWCAYEVSTMVFGLTSVWVSFILFYWIELSLPIFSSFKYCVS